MRISSIPLLKKPLYSFGVATILILVTINSFVFLATGRIGFGSFFVTGFISIVLFTVFRRFYGGVTAKSRSIREKLQEKVNLARQATEANRAILETLPLKCEKVSSLFNLSQRLVELVDSDEIFDFLTHTCADLFPQLSNLLLFEMHRQSDALELVRSHKKDNIVIHEKQGDVFDKWILRHNQSLIVEDVTRDFRFDSSHTVAFSERGAHSFVASPLSVGERVFGVLRLESLTPGAFNLDDSRLLRSVCDLAAVVLERAILFKRIEELAIKDSLTGLCLREHFGKRFKEELKRARVKKHSIGIIMLDVDNFKQINDTYGHIVGDLVLKRLSRILADCTGGGADLSARFGGEEFIVFFADAGLDELKKKAEQIRSKVESTTVTFRRKKVVFTVSVGLAVYPEDGVDDIDIINKADKRLLAAKRKGKNRVCFTGE